MRLTPAAVAEERDRLRDRAPVVVPLINEVRTDLGEVFGIDVGEVTEAEYREEVDRVFADGDLAVNVAGLAGLLRDLDVAGDYPGFVVDEMLGRQLAGTIAGGQPLQLLGEATFHYADLLSHGGCEVPRTSDKRAGTAREREDETAGADDLDAALAAGFQTRLPGWDWTERESPFRVE